MESQPLGDPYSVVHNESNNLVEEDNVHNTMKRIRTSPLGYFKLYSAIVCMFLLC